MKLTKFCAVLALISATSAQAVELPFTPYVVGSMGMSKIKTDTTGATSKDTDDGVFSLGVGAMLNKNLAFELRYLDPGRYSVTVAPDTMTLRGNGVALGTVLSLPVNEDVSLFVRADAISLRVKATDSSSGSTTDTNTVLGYGMGAQFALGQDVALRAQYERIRHAESQGDTANIDSVGIAVLKNL